MSSFCLQILIDLANCCFISYLFTIGMIPTFSYQRSVFTLKKCTRSNDFNSLAVMKLCKRCLQLSASALMLTRGVNLAENTWHRKTVHALNRKVLFYWCCLNAWAQMKLLAKRNIRVLLHIMTRDLIRFGHTCSLYGSVHVSHINISYNRKQPVEIC